MHEHENPAENWTEGTSFDGKGEFSSGEQPGGEPDLDAVIDAMHNELN